MPSDDENRHAMYVDFIGNVDDGATIINTFDNSTPIQESRSYNPALSARMTMDYGFADLSWAQMDGHLCDPASLFQSEPSWELEKQELEGESQSHPHPCSQSLWNAQQHTQKSLSTVADYALHEVKSESLARFPIPKTIRDLPPLKPKLTPYFLGVVTGSDNNSITSQRPRKPGRRNGPMDAEGRKGAHQMRHIRACLTCKLRKTKVS